MAEGLLCYNGFMSAEDKTPDEMTPEELAEDLLECLTVEEVDIAIQEVEPSYRVFQHDNNAPTLLEVYTLDGDVVGTYKIKVSLEPVDE